MKLIVLAPRICGAVLLFAFLGPSAGWANHLPPAIQVVIGNSSNGALVWANFDELTSVQLNTDANKNSGLRSVEFHFNTCDARVDIVAANTNGGDILLYPGGSQDWSTGTSLCTGGSCPQRPEGLSARSDGLLVAANSGAAGTPAGLWFFKSAACGGAAVFEPGVPGGQFMVSAGGVATPVGKIIDTVFVRLLGGNLKVGDLLVTTESPSLIARVRAEHIAALLANGTPLPPADILVPESFFGSSKPAAMAFVHGTSAVGSSEALLVTVPPARVLKLNFGQTDFGSASLQDFVFFAEFLGNGPLGIDAGTSGADSFMVVADRQLGRAIRVRLYVDSNTGHVSLCPGGIEPCAAEFKAITSGLQFPQGVAFNSYATAAGSCAGPQGCALAGIVKLFLPLEQPSPTMLGPQQLDPDAIFIAQLYLIEDTRGTANTSLALPGLGGNYRLPAACRGFDIDGDPLTLPIVPVVVLNKNFDFKPGTIMQVQELLSGIFPQLEDCTETGARIYHHQQPDEAGEFNTPEQGVLMDKTLYCSNPSRTGNEGIQSPFAYCSDLYYSIASSGSLSNSQKSALKSEVFGGIDRLQSVVMELPDTAPYQLLRADLLNKLDVIRNYLKKQRPTTQEYLAASGVFSSGASAVFMNKANLASDPPDPTLPEFIYGNLLIRWLALGFYTSETAAMTPYCPPQDVREAELPGISCGT